MEEEELKIVFVLPGGDGSNDDEIIDMKQNSSSKVSFKTKVGPMTDNSVDEVTELRDKLTDCLTNYNPDEVTMVMNTFRTLKSQGIIKGLLDERLLMENNGMHFLQRSIVTNNCEMIKSFLAECDESVYNHRTTGLLEGGTILHDCVIKNRQDIIKVIHEKIYFNDFKALLASQAIGSFIKTNFQGYELPLFLACWTRNFELVKYLLHLCPEALYMTDSHGHNLLHCLAKICQEGATNFAKSVFEMIYASDGGKIAIEHLLIMKCKTQHHEKPLTYALRLGELSFAQLIINTSLKKDNVQYGPAHFTEYDITDLEACPDVGKSDFIPGMILIGTSSNLSKLHCILHIEPWLKLQNLRWDYYKYVLLRRALIQFVMLILMTVGIVMTPPRALMRELRANYTAQKAALNETLTVLEMRGYFGTEGVVVFVFQVIFSVYGLFILSGTLYYAIKMTVISQQKGLQFTEYVERMSNPVTGNGIYILLGLLFSLSVFIGNITTYFDYDEVDIFFMLELIAGYCSMTFYFRCLDYTSFFTVTVNKMLFGDVVRFCAIIVGYLVGFGAGFYVLFKNKQGGPPNGLDNFGEALVTTYKLMIGLSDLPTMRVDYEIILVILYFSYTILMTIMLFNMLIGIMANTINDVAEQKKYLGDLQRLSTLLYAEAAEFGKPFTSKCIQNGQMTVKTVPFAGKLMKRLFIECLEVQNEKDDDAKGEDESQKYILGIKITNPLKLNNTSGAQKYDF